MISARESLFSIIGDVVCNHPLRDDMSLSDLEELYKLAKRHDLAHLVGYAMINDHVKIDDDRFRTAFLQQYYSAIRRVTILEKDLAEIKMAFEEAGIDYVLLKGAVLRKIYPEEFMRVSTDMDILVHPVHLEPAERVLAEKLRYKTTDSGSHHDHVTSPSGFHIDLHFRLTERESEARPYLDTVWERCRLVEGKQHEYEMKDEMFYLFHMYHMAVHFQLGGCGIRPVLDTWILNHRIDFDSDARRLLLEQSGLLKFAETIESIAEGWLSGSPSTVYPEVEDYILKGGLYGGNQHIAAVQAQNGSRFKYIMTRVFPPYKSISCRYPVLKKWPILLPFCWLHRLVESVFLGKTKKARYELSKSKEDIARSEEIKDLFDQVGLSPFL
ncbi:MAG: nucleotidyltransferase family protein [Clostridiales bacterium]|nr:nucleotidyltransferase family protein [Clostridiales bacterium]